MKTVLCNNHLCGKEYSIKFDNCPFCGTPNPISESERKNMIENDNEDVTENVVEDKQFNGIVIGLIWISIFFFGIRNHDIIYIFNNYILFEIIIIFNILLFDIFIFSCFFSVILNITTVIIIYSYIFFNTINFNFFNLISFFVI